MSKIIDRFSGFHDFLSNFHPAPVTMQFITYPTVENAFQAAKVSPWTPWERIPFVNVTPGQAKKMGRKVVLRKGWESIKQAVMFNLLIQKFTKHKALGEALANTGDALLVEGNTWGDRYWGVCGGTGDNHLGLLLMKVRESL